MPGGGKFARYTAMSFCSPLPGAQTEQGVALLTNPPQIIVLFHLISALEREAPAGEVRLFS